MRFSASRLNTWMSCPLQGKFKYIDGLPEATNSKTAFGSCVHLALDTYNRTANLDQAIAVFKSAWNDPDSVGAGFDVWAKFTSFGGLMERGIQILREYHDKQRWESRRVLGIEHRFLVPFGDYEITGAVDLIETKKSSKGIETLRIVDFKTAAKEPRIGSLYANVQFSIYLYAAQQPEFWVGSPDFPGLPNGQWLYETHKDMPTRGIWYHLWTNKEMDAGKRSKKDFERLYRAMTEIQKATELGVFVPNISGETCPWCFAGETPVITSMGTRAIRELAGQSVHVLSDYGRWRPAEVRSFGVQSLYAVDLSRTRETKTIYATGEHRWIVKTDRRVMKVTSELEAGDKLLGVIGHGLKETSPSAFGVARGIVFGDGHRDRRGSNVDLHDEKMELERFFPLQPKNKASRPDRSVEGRGEGGEYITVSGLPAYWKDELPSLEEDRSYLYGWLAGYFATDGSVSKSGTQSVIDSAVLEHIQYVRDVCYQLGVLSHRITRTVRKGYGDEETPMYRTTLSMDTLPLDFYVLGKHRERVINRTAAYDKSNLEWKVEGVRKTNRIEEVYCAIVPETGTFALEDNILTANCSYTEPCGVKIPVRQQVMEEESWFQ